MSEVKITPFEVHKVLNELWGRADKYNDPYEEKKWLKSGDSFEVASDLFNEHFWSSEIEENKLEDDTIEEIEASVTSWQAFHKGL